MDEKDRELVAALRRNARASVSELAALIGVTRATIRARMEKLIANGEILGFTVILKSESRDLPVRGVMLIGISGKGTDRVWRLLDGIPNVETIHTTNGRWDLIVEIGAESLPALDAVLRRIRLIDGVANSETSLYLTTKRSRRARATAEPAEPNAR